MARQRHVPRVLIIDAFDEGEMYADAFRFRGMIVCTARTATDGLMLAASCQADVIVQGMAFPDLSGIELATTLKRTPATSPVPLIVLTGFVDETSLEAIRATGCSAVVQKPCVPGDLLRLIRRMLRPRQRGSVPIATDAAAGRGRPPGLTSK